MASENRRITRQQFHLFRIGHAAENCHSLQVKQLTSVFVSRCGDLQGNAACRRQYQHLWRSGLETGASIAGAGRLTFLVRRADFPCRARLICELMKCRQHESGGFSGAGLRTDQQVVSGHGRRNGLGLDGGGFGVTGESERSGAFREGQVQPKCHQCLSNGSASRDHTEVAHGRRKYNANQRNSDEKLRRRGEFETFRRYKRALCQGGVGQRHQEAGGLWKCGQFLARQGHVTCNRGGGVYQVKVVGGDCLCPP